MSGIRPDCDAELVVASPLLGAALEIARYGFPVYQVRPREKRPLHKGWQRSATTDPGRIVNAWKVEPQANVGVLCGSGLVVLDADSRRGSEAIADLELPATTAVRTPRGEHLYFTGQARSVRDLLPDVELRGHGSGVLGAGSIHPTGSAYEWIIPPWEARPVPLPTVLRSLLDHSPKPKYAPTPEPIRQGHRNSTLTRIAGSLRGRFGLNDAALAAVLLAINKKQCDPPLAEAEVERIARSASTWKAPPLWITSPASFALDERLSARARLILRVLCDHGDNEGRCRPGIRRLANISGLAKRTVEAAIHELERTERVAVERSKGGNRYTIRPWVPERIDQGEKRGSSVLAGGTDRVVLA